MNASTPVLELSEVRRDARSEPLSLVVRPREVVLLAFGRQEAAVQGLDGIVQGLDEPFAGEVRYLGRTWNERSGFEQAQARGSLGWIPAPDRAGWVSNLDLDENVILPARATRRRTEEEARGIADRLARQFGLPGVDRGRPAWASEIALRRLAWVRALLAAPDVLLADRVAAGEDDPDALAALVAEMDRVRRQGMGVLWIEPEVPPAARDGIEDLTVVNWPEPGPVPP